MRIKFKVGKNLKTGIRRVKNNNLIDAELKNRQRSDELKRLQEKAAKANHERKEAEERRKLKDQIRQAEVAKRKAKYAGWYRAGNVTRKGLKSSGNLVGQGLKSAAKRVEKNSKSNDFNVLFGMPGDTKRYTGKKRKSKRKPKRVVYY